MPLPTRSRSRVATPREHAGLSTGVLMMLGNSFLMSVGFFMLIPLASVHYTRDLGFTAAAVGLALAVRQLSQQELMLTTGTLAERVGYRPVLIAGMLIRALGFAAFAASETLPRLLVASVIAAVGGALFEVTSRSYVAVLSPPERRADGFALWSLASNAGLAVGPAVGALLVRASFTAVVLVAAATYVVGALGTWRFVPRTAERGTAPARSPGLVATLAVVTRDRALVLFSAIMCGYYLLVQQLFITVPLEAERLTGSTDSLGLVYLVNALLAIALQFPLTRAAARRFSPMSVIVGGTVLLAASLLSISLGGGLALLLIGVAGVTLSRVLIDPMVNVSVAGIAGRAGDGLLASYFGFSALSIAIGGSLGQLLGGWLFDLAGRHNFPALVWLTMGATGALVAVCLLSFSRGATGQLMNAAGSQSAPHAA